MWRLTFYKIVPPGPHHAIPEHLILTREQHVLPILKLVFAAGDGLRIKRVADSGRMRDRLERMQESLFRTGPKWIFNGHGIGHLLVRRHDQQDPRSEERRVGKEHRSRWSPSH